MVKFRPTVRNVFILISLENFVPYDRVLKAREKVIRSRSVSHPLNNNS